MLSIIAYNCEKGWPRLKRPWISSTLAEKGGTNSLIMFIDIRKSTLFLHVAENPWKTSKNDDMLGTTQEFSLVTRNQPCIQRPVEKLFCLCAMQTGSWKVSTTFCLQASYSHYPEGNDEADGAVQTVIRIRRTWKQSSLIFDGEIYKIIRESSFQNDQTLRGIHVGQLEKQFWHCEEKQDFHLSWMQQKLYGWKG